MSETTLVPPHDSAAERAVLGALLIDQQAWLGPDVTELLPEHFYEYRHQLIFRCMQDLRQAGIPTDLVTVSGELRRAAKMDQVGGTAYLAGLGSEVPTSLHTDAYAVMLREQHVLRALIQASGEAMTLAYAQQEPMEVILDQAEKLVLDVTRKTFSSKGGAIDAPTAFSQLKVWLQETTDQDINVHSTGFHSLDEMLIGRGFKPGQMITIAARPSMGKTSIAMNIARNMAEVRPVLVFSLEMPQTDLNKRLLSTEAMVELKVLEGKQFTPEQQERVDGALQRLEQLQLHFYDEPHVTLQTIRREARKLKAERGDLGAIFIDYLQLLEPVGGKKSENRQQEISAISRGIKNLAREFSVPVIVLSQLSREVEKRADKRPVLSDLRESGSIEQDSDIVMFIYRDEYYDKNTSKKRVAEIIFAKQRNGPVGTVEMSFIAPYTRFTDLAA